MIDLKDTNVHSKYSPFIPWVNFEWSRDKPDIDKKRIHELTHQECMEFLSKSGNKEEYNRFSDWMLNIIAIEQKDYRKWPIQTWDYVGYVNLNPSGRVLECEKWGYKWDDPSLYPMSKRIYKSVTNFFSLDSEVLNDFNKIMSGEPWPNCGICITKLDGCDHMVCGKCGHEFWWLWLGGYPGYTHSEITYWPLRKLIIIMFCMYFLLVVINFKICLISPTFRYYERIFLKWFIFSLTGKLIK